MAGLEARVPGDRLEPRSLGAVRPGGYYFTKIGRSEHRPPLGCDKLIGIRHDVSLKATRPRTRRMRK